MKLQKACFNKDCSSYFDRKKYSSDFSFCPKCTSKLSYVCSTKDCYNELENPLKKYCENCLLKREQKKKKIKDDGFNAAKNTPAVIGAFAGVVTQIPKIITGVVKILPKK